MVKQKKEAEGPELVKTWQLAPSSTLGSAVRAKGILQEIRARLPITTRKLIDLDGSVVTLAMPEASRNGFHAATAIVSKILGDAASLAIIPREIEDILAISASERRRWLNDGRLPSAGTRTVRLRGRAKQITFHVFDPNIVEDLLDRSVVDDWREEDKAASAEKRRRAAMKRILTRSLTERARMPSSPAIDAGEASLTLRGWEEFGADGLLK